jgi:hypothetical protein
MEETHAACQLLQMEDDVIFDCGGTDSNELMPITGFVLIVIGTFLADWATSDCLTLKYHGWPKMVRRSRLHRPYFHLPGLIVILMGTILISIYSIAVGIHVTVILFGLFLLGIPQIVPLFVFHSLRRLGQIFKR